MKIKNRLYERDLKEKNKRKRYELRYDMERNFHKRALGDEERSAKISMNKINVLRYNETTDRGFDILTNKQYNIANDVGSKTIYEPSVKPPPSTWTKIKYTSNQVDEANYSAGNTASDIKYVNNNEVYTEQRNVDDISSKDLNDRLGDTVQDEFIKKEQERRSKRLDKGCKTMTNFHNKTTVSKNTNHNQVSIRSNR